jgi:hypothetical protein
LVTPAPAQKQEHIPVLRRTGDPAQNYKKVLQFRICWMPRFTIAGNELQVPNFAEAP